jgi:hypothetical protein
VRSVGRYGSGSSTHELRLTDVRAEDSVDALDVPDG